MIQFGNENHGWLLAKESWANYAPGDIVISRTAKDGTLLGGVIFSAYTGNSVCIHVAGLEKNWLSIGLLWVVFNYVFVQLRCAYLFGFIKQTNHKALDFARKIGFITCATIPGVYEDGGVVVMSMTRDHCRWIDLQPRTLRPGVPDGLVQV